MLYQQEHGACGTYMQEHDACGIGSIVNIDGRKDHKVLDDALHIVEKLEHRAGKDATGEVGDGVGILTQISHKFFKAAAQEADIKLGGEGDYGIGMFFLPQETLKRTFAMRMFEVIADKSGMEILGWRDVPVHEEILGKVAVACQNRERHRLRQKTLRDPPRVRAVL